jgi:hypothetical protein
VGQRLILQRGQLGSANSSHQRSSDQRSHPAFAASKSARAAQIGPGHRGAAQAPSISREAQRQEDGMRRMMAAYASRIGACGSGLRK